MRRSGDNPVLTYVDAQGVLYTHIATEYGAAGEYGKRTLPTKKITITYLNSNPSEARVEDWFSSSSLFSMIFGVFCLLLGGTYIFCFPYRTFFAENVSE